MSGPIHLPLADTEKSSSLPQPGSTPPARPSRSSFKAALAAKGAIGLLAIASLGYQFAPSLSYSRDQYHAGNVWKESRALSGYLDKVTGRAEGGGGAGPHGLGLPVLTNKAAEKLFLTVPEAESARAASHSFTAVDHIAGTEGDRLSALRVKSQWEELLHLPVTAADEHIFEAGSFESRDWLTRDTKEPKHHRHRHHKKGRKHKEEKHQKDGKGNDKKVNGNLLGQVVRKAKRACGMHVPAKEQDQADAATLPSFPGLGPKPRVWIDTYYPLLNFPISHSLTLTPPNATKPSFVAKLLEDDVPEDPTSGAGRFDVPTFHGFSKNGTATGQLVYGRSCGKQAIDELVERGVNFTDKVVLCSYGGTFRGLKVEFAARAGAVGVLVYTDPAEDGEITVEAGYEAYPHGPARQPSSVQRGSVQALSLYAGDPLTPHLPAYKNQTRLDRADPSLNVPRIPSLPISYEDAVPLLKSLNGHGIRLGGGGKNGHKEGGLEYLGVEYWTGPGPDTAELVNEMDDKVTAMWNAYAVIPGLIPDEVVILGNHNDAWTFGAGDPNSGTAAVHEVVKGLGELLKTGWRPLRTIVVASWDGEEFGLLGSTEFGEDFPDWLKENVVAYINVDVATAGSRFGLGASPSLATLFTQISSEIADPDSPDRTLLDKLIADGPDDDDLAELASAAGLAATTQLPAERYVGPLGSGSDFTVFLQYLGIASGNVGFGRKPTDPVYHYHSIYDSAYWMDTFGDPSFERHVATAKVMGLALLRLADELILPVNVSAYAGELGYYARKVRAIAAAEAGLSDEARASLDLAALDGAIEAVQLATASLDIEATLVRAELERIHKHAPLDLHRLKAALVKVRSINKRLQHFEGGFIDEAGLDGREWYRSLVVSPGRYLGYGATTFPGVTEALVLDKDVKRAGYEVKRLVKALDRVARGLYD